MRLPPFQNPSPSRGEGLKVPVLIALASLALLAMPTTDAVAQRQRVSKDVQALRDPTRLVALGQRLEGQGKLEEAMAFYERALQFDPRHVGALQAAGNNALKRGDGAEAFGYIAPWAATHPNNPQAQLALGSSLVMRQQPTEALAVLKRARALGAPAAAVAVQQGIALDLQGDQRKAQLAYAEALQASPGDRDATQRMALSLAVSGDYAAALRLLQPLAVAADAADVRRTLALVYALSDQGKAAVEIAGPTMMPEEAKVMAAFYARLPGLSRQDKALAIHLGRMPLESIRMPLAPPAPVPTPTQAAAPPAPTPAPASDLTSVPRIWVQLGSSPDRAALGSEWQRIRSRATDLLGSQRPYLQRTARTSRLLIGPFDTSRQAEALARQLMARRVAAVVNRTPAGSDIEALEVP